MVDRMTYIVHQHTIKSCSINATVKARCNTSQRGNNATKMFASICTVAGSHAFYYGYLDALRNSRICVYTQIQLCVCVCVCVCVCGGGVFTMKMKQK